MNLQEVMKELGSLHNWSLGNNAIVKDFEFKDFKEAIDFVNKIGEIAEKQSHHPKIVVLYNRVEIMLTTHSLKGLSEKDFTLAREIDGI